MTTRMGPPWYETPRVFFEFRHQPLQFLQGLKEQYGRFARFPLGPFTAYLVTDRACVEEVLQKTDLYHKDKITKFVVTPLFGTSLGLSDGEFHRLNRKLIAPVLSQSRIGMYENIMHEQIRLTLESFQQQPHIVLDHVFTDLTLRVITQAMFGTKVVATDAFIEAVEAVIVGVGHRLKEPVPLPLSIPTATNQKMKRGLETLEKTIYEIIQTHQSQNNTSTNNVLSSLYNATDAEGRRLSEKHIRDEVMEMLIAGHETTAYLLVWIFYLLHQYPQVREKLEGELDRVLEGRLPTLADLHHLPYTEMVVKEALRLFPNLWLTSREPIRDVKLGEHWVKKGEIIFISPYLNHRDPEYFDAPEQFIPERFANQNERNWPAFQYFPFGGGSHICVGRSFATLEAMKITATFASKLRLDLINSDEMSLTPAVTLRPTHPLKAQVRWRT